MNTSSQRIGPVTAIRTWGRQLLDRIWSFSPRRKRSCGKRMSVAVPARQQNVRAGSGSQSGFGLIGDQVEFVGGPLDGFCHTLHDPQEIPFRLAIPISGEMFQSLDEYPYDWNPSWSISTRGISSIAFYMLYTTEEGWRYHFWGSGAV